MSAAEKQFMESLRAQLVAAADRSDYDHRLLLAEVVETRFPHMLEPEQLRYARFKRAVAEVLKPATIYEVGIGWGVSALAFLNGYPRTHFFGIDNAEMGIHPAEALFDCDESHYQVIDSDELPAFVHPAGPIELLHIDGGHGRDHKARDIVKALEARPEWILVDDVQDVMVAAGTFDGLYRAAKNSLSMLYFENSHTGNLLIHVNRQEPEYR
jgi:predicted O-methyltransferase YrrM